jgi:methyltransferase (TIGR00027 family)
VGRTALAVARVRATESARPDRLFDDPLAAAFAAAAPVGQASIDGQPPGPGGTPATRLGFHVVIRTRFYDDYLLGAVMAGCRQVVLVAAGLDCRAFRLDWPDGVSLFELDQPEVLEFKAAVLGGQGAQPRCRRAAVPVDLRGDWPARLTGAGFDPAQPVAWLVEGLLIYLSSDQAARLLTDVGRLSAPGSQVALERGEAAASLIRQTSATPRGARLAALWQGGLGEDNAAWLAGHGWRSARHDLAEVAAGYGRPAPDDARSGFVIATR